MKLLLQDSYHYFWTCYIIHTVQTKKSMFHFFFCYTLIKTTEIITKTNFNYCEVMLCYYNTAKELETNKKHYLYAKTLLCLLQILHSQFYDSKRVFTRLKYNAHVSTCVRPPSLHPSVRFFCINFRVQKLVKPILCIIRRRSSNCFAEPID